MKLLRTLIGPTRTEDAAERRLVAMETHIKALYDHVEQLRLDVRDTVRDLQQLRQDEAMREAAHAAMVDRLSRLYKRVSTRIAKEAGAADEPEESVMDFRKRLGR